MKRRNYGGPAPPIPVTPWMAPPPPRDPTEFLNELGRQTHHFVVGDYEEAARIAGIATDCGVNVEIRVAH